MRKWISGYENIYEIDTDGNLFRHLKSGDVKQMKPVLNKSGYLFVTLSKDSNPARFLVHRLVAEHFISNPEKLPIVDHIDENKTNNCASNLRWCTAQQNAYYYANKEGKAHHVRLGKKRKAQLTAYSNKLQDTIKELNKFRKELHKKERELEKVEKTLVAKEELIQHQKAVLDKYAEDISTVRLGYSGCANTKGMKFESVDALVEATGKQVNVDGVDYRSCKAAADHIVAEELKLGNIRNKATIDKELRRFVQGLRPAWLMYGRYKVDYSK